MLLCTELFPVHRSCFVFLKVAGFEPLISKIQRQVISCGVFHSVNDLARKIMHFIRNYNKMPMKMTAPFMSLSRC